MADAVRRPDRRLLLLLLLYRRRKRTQKRRRHLWVRKIFQSRKSMGEYHALIQEMRLFDHSSFYKYFHMSPARFDNLLSRVGPIISKKVTRLREPISAGERLAATLRFLVTGDSMQTISFSFRLGHSTVSYIIESTCDALWEVLSPEFVNVPKTSEEWKKISEGFEAVWNFPHCVGAIDGKHVVMQAPSNAGSQYFNYKGTHSVVLLAVCDYNYCFTLLDIGDYGRQSDGGVLSNSAFGRAIKNGSLSLPGDENIDGLRLPIPYFFVADQAFPLTNYMLRPYPGTYLPLNQRIFNYRLSRARRVIENAFGILATKFRIFRRPIVAKPDKVTKITEAACALHNYLKISEAQCPPAARHYCPPGYVDQEDREGNIIPGDWRSHDDNQLSSIHQIGGNRYSSSAKQLRDMLTNYFISTAGALAWQQTHVTST